MSVLPLPSSSSSVFFSSSPPLARSAGETLAPTPRVRSRAEGKKEDFERWEENYCQVFEGHQEPTQRSFSWDGVDGEPGVEQPFLDAGYRSLNHVILKGNEFNTP